MALFYTLRILEPLWPKSIYVNFRLAVLSGVHCTYLAIVEPAPSRASHQIRDRDLLEHPGQPNSVHYIRDGRVMGQWGEVIKCIRRLIWNSLFIDICIPQWIHQRWAQLCTGLLRRRGSTLGNFYDGVKLFWSYFSFLNNFTTVFTVPLYFLSNFCNLKFLWEFKVYNGGIPPPSPCAHLWGPLLLNWHSQMHCSL